MVLSNTGGKLSHLFWVQFALADAKLLREVIFDRAEYKEIFKSVVFQSEFYFLFFSKYWNITKYSNDYT